MSILEIIKLNKRILKVYNSCDWEVFSELIDDVLCRPDTEVTQIFTSKLYLWNVIRPRDFYKMAAHHIVQSTQDITKLDQVEHLVHIILTTTSSMKIRTSFVWNILKQVPLLTIDTVQYASPEKIHSILRSDRAVLADAAIAPFVTEVRDLRTEVEMCQNIMVN